MKNKVKLNENIYKQLEKYGLITAFSFEEEVEKWISKLNGIERQNILNLNINKEEMIFDKKLLLNKDLLNTRDYNERVKALVSIKNAEGSEHLFDRMLVPEFLHSPKFYQDIETLKRAKSARTPLWIIGDPTFINSPYHDEDFELLVTAKDTSGENRDYLVSESIALIAKNEASIKSGYHREDLQTIIRYSARALQTPHSYPEGSINSLAMNKVSLEKDKYHLENMEILAQNKEVGNFLYNIMTNEKAIKRRDYRKIIQEMIEHKENMLYAYLLCIYAVGEDHAKEALNMCQLDYPHRLKQYNIDELLELVDEQINIIDTTIEDKEIGGIESKETKEKTFKKIADNLRKKNS